MLEFTVAGLALGAIYAIIASGLVITYVSAGVLNFAFGPMAFFLARFYYYLNTEQGLGVISSFLIAIVIGGPALGIVLYLVLFQHISRSTTLIKVVATIGLSVALPAVSRLIFGDLAVITVPGLAPEPVRIVDFGPVAVSLNQLYMLGALVILVVCGALLLRFTQIGLKVRALVDTEAMSALVGVNTRVVAIGVWAFSTFLAGLAGVLVAPVVGLSSSQFVLLVSAAFSAVVVARFTSIGVAIGAGLFVGWATTVIQNYLPSESDWTGAIVAGIPFLLIFLALMYFQFSGKGADEAAGVGGALDRAIAVSGAAGRRGTSTRTLDANGSRGPLVVPSVIVGVIAIAVLPLLVQSYWVGLVALGVCMAIVFLSFTLLTGQGGMVWLCQAALAGVGAVATAHLVTENGWPLLAALPAAALITAIVGSLLGLLMIRLGTLFIALVTLCFGLLIETVALSREWIENGGAGIALARPEWLLTDGRLLYFALIVFCLVSLVIVNVRRSSLGIALAAIRSSEPGARSISLSLLQGKLAMTFLASGIAGLGGGMMALYSGAAAPGAFSTLAGLVWLAVLVTMGVRSNIAALLAGVSFTFVPGLFSSYVDPAYGEIPTALFGLGAIMVARNPDGIVSVHARQVADLVAAWLPARKSARERKDTLQSSATTVSDETGRHSAETKEGVAP